MTAFSYSGLQENARDPFIVHCLMKNPLKILYPCLLPMQRSGTGNATDRVIISVGFEQNFWDSLLLRDPLQTQPEAGYLESKTYAGAVPAESERNMHASNLC